MVKDKKKKLQKDYRININQKKYDSVVKNEIYSVQRLDIIVIALSTGGIIIVLNTLQSLHVSDSLTWNNRLYLLIALITFIVSISGNILAQHASIKTSRTEKKHYLNKLRELHDLDYIIIPENKCWEKIRIIGEYISYIFLILGVITLTIFLTFI